MVIKNFKKFRKHVLVHIFGFALLYVFKIMTVIKKSYNVYNNLSGTQNELQGNVEVNEFKDEKDDVVQIQIFRSE